jgi:hypothetical protein
LPYFSSIFPEQASFIQIVQDSELFRFLDHGIEGGPGCLQVRSLPGGGLDPGRGDLKLEPDAALRVNRGCHLAFFSG